MDQPLKTPHTLRINLQNPITHEEINGLITAISNTKTSTHLLINFGQHEFASLAVLRYCKEALTQIADQLEQFDKIAFIVPPPYQGVNQDQLRYYQSEAKAIAWFQEG